MDKPFIYIAALRRTGSTMLCEALTQSPHSFVFNEPNVATNRFVVRDNEREQLAEHGIDLEGFVRRWSTLRRRFLFHGFRRRLVPQISAHYHQVGIKEIFNDGWERIVDAFPDVRIVLTARDPRDVFLSLRGRYLAGHAIWEGPFTPDRVAESLNHEFRHQQSMADHHDVFRIRYEDLCLEPDRIQDLYRFVSSDITSVGPLGQFLASDAKRVAEGAMHGGVISDKRVARWRSLDDESLASDAQRVFDLMPDYCAFWNYSSEGVAAP